MVRLKKIQVANCNKKLMGVNFKKIYQNLVTVNMYLNTKQVWILDKWVVFGCQKFGNQTFVRIPNAK